MEFVVFLINAINSFACMSPLIRFSRFYFLSTWGKKKKRRVLKLPLVVV